MGRLDRWLGRRRRPAAPAPDDGPRDARGDALPTDPDFAEYRRYLSSPRRLLFLNFVAGLARGLGMSVGFTILGAVLLYAMRQLVWQNIPWLSQFIAEIVVLVDAKT